MNLPSEFISIITNTFGEDGDALIANLPALIEEASSRWGLTNIRPVDNLSYNFVAFAESPSPLGRGMSKGQGEGYLFYRYLGLDLIHIDTTALAV